MSLIYTKALCKNFILGNETIKALVDIDLSIEEGEFISITGSSGSGKSTLMHILGLLDVPTSGSYDLSGQSVANLSDNERAHLRNQRLGFIFQSFHLLARASALRNVAMPLVYSASYSKTLSEAEILKRAGNALDRVGLSDRVNHLPNELSGGQRQRVAIARALVNSPSILFADEPTGNLDSKSGNDIFRIFEELHRDGVTIIVVTHDAALASRARRIIALSDGRITEDKYVAP